jgi:hypothetical protein
MLLRCATITQATGFAGLLMWARTRACRINNRGQPNTGSAPKLPYMRAPQHFLRTLYPQSDASGQIALPFSGGGFRQCRKSLFNNTLHCCYESGPTRNIEFLWLGASIIGGVPTMRQAPITLIGNATDPALVDALRDLRRELYALGLGPLFYWVTVVQSRRTMSARGLAWYTFGERKLRLPRWTQRTRRESARAFGAKALSLRAVLRHEFGHALADYLHLEDRRCFKRTFGQGTTLTRYAELNADEDFAETFMRFVTWGGKLRRTNPDRTLRAKWRYVRLAIREAGGLRPRLKVSCPVCGERHVCRPGTHRCAACATTFRVAS